MPRFKHAFWNTLEHGLVRVLDAGTSFVLLWVLRPEDFSALALAKAWVAPALFFFFSPEVLLYRDFGVWKEQGIQALGQNIRCLRYFAWTKLFAGVLISVPLAIFLPSEAEDWSFSFYSLIWAFSLVLAPQVMGADREFLRLNLNLRALSFLSFFQKVLFFLGTLCAVRFFPGEMNRLALFGVISLVISGLAARYLGNRSLKKMGYLKEFLSVRDMARPLFGSFKSFVIWQHLSGVVLNWVQSMDLFVLGLFLGESLAGFPVTSRALGEYGAVLMIAGFSLAVPLALANLFSVWLGRRVEKDFESERKELLRGSVWVGGYSVVQAIGIYFGVQWVFEAFFQHKWPLEEQAQMLVWLQGLLGGTVILGTSFLLSSWVMLRRTPKNVFIRIYVPWCVLSAAIYCVASKGGGITGAAFSNIAVGLLFAVLLGLYMTRRKEAC